MNTSGTINQYFDDSLTGLLSLLERTLPNETCCADEEYIEWEKTSYQAHCEYALRDMLERTERIVWHRRKEPGMFHTEVFSYETFSTIRDRLEAQRHRQTMDGGELIENLKDALGRLINFGLTDEEYLVKWEKLKRRAQLQTFVTNTASTKIQEYYEDEQPDERTLCQYILKHNYRDDEVLSFMRAYQGKAKDGGYKMTKEKTDSTVTHSSTSSSKKQKSNAKVVQTNFCYRWLQDCPERITQLYQKLLFAGWIAKDTDADDFYDVFAGEDKDVNIKWTGTQQNLWYLFKLIIDRQYVTFPKGATKWVVVGSHFVNAESRRFDGWNKQKEPTISKPTIEAMAELLNPVHVEKPLKREDMYDLDY